MNVVRVAESAWGNIETAEGKYRFDWLDSFLLDAHQYHLKVILGTSSYLPPQWLIQKYPDILLQDLQGKAYPFIKKSPCIDQPTFRRYVQNYVRTVAGHYKDHPAVIGWQLDNEIDITVNTMDYNPAAEAAWQRWLKEQFGSTDSLNKKFQLNMYGMQINRFAQLPIPKSNYFPVTSNSIKLNYSRFEKDHVFDFLKEQATILRKATTKQWISTNWVPQYNALTDAPEAAGMLDVPGLDVYHTSGYNPGNWKNIAMQFDINRSSGKTNNFLLLETTIGVNGNNSMNQFTEWAGGVMIQRDKFFMQNIYPAAFGAAGVLYWTGNRIQGTHAPYYGAVVGWGGEPEPEYPWVAEVGAFYKKWGPALLSSTVAAQIGIYTSFDQRSAIQLIEHVKGSPKIVSDCFDAVHRMGYGVDALNDARMKDPAQLKKYSLILLPAATILEDPEIIQSLETYVQQGGRLIITPLTDYITKDALFQQTLGGHLASLTGTTVRTTRLFSGSTAVDYEAPTVVWKGMDTLKTSGLQYDGLAEFFSVQDNAEVVATFNSSETVINQHPAAVKHNLGAGKVLKLAFMPDVQTLASLINQFVPNKQTIIVGLAPEGVHIVPRADKSVFIINTSPSQEKLTLHQVMKDRVTGTAVQTQLLLKAYQVLWLE